MPQPRPPKQPNYQQPSGAAVGISEWLGAVMRKHKDVRKRHMSTWYIQTPRRRKIRLQDFKGRLYLVGCLYDGLQRLLPYECPLGEIIKTYGKPTST